MCSAKATDRGGGELSKVAEEDPFPTHGMVSPRRGKKSRGGKRKRARQVSAFECLEEGGGRKIGGKEPELDHSGEESSDSGEKLNEAIIRCLPSDSGTTIEDEEEEEECDGDDGLSSKDDGDSDQGEDAAPTGNPVWLKPYDPKLVSPQLEPSKSKSVIEVGLAGKSPVTLLDIVPVEEEAYKGVDYAVDTDSKDNRQKEENEGGDQEEGEEEGEKDQEDEQDQEADEEEVGPHGRPLIEGTYLGSPIRNPGETSQKERRGSKPLVGRNPPPAVGSEVDWTSPLKAASPPKGHKPGSKPLEGRKTKDTVEIDALDDGSPIGLSTPKGDKKKRRKKPVGKEVMAAEEPSLQTAAENMFSLQCRDFTQLVHMAMGDGVMAGGSESQPSDDHVVSMEKPTVRKTRSRAREDAPEEVTPPTRKSRKEEEVTPAKKSRLEEGATLPATTKVGGVQRSKRKRTKG